MEKFYVVHGTRQLGPFSPRQLKEFYLGNELPEDSIVWSEDLSVKQDIKVLVKEIIRREETPPPVPPKAKEARDQLIARRARARRSKKRQAQKQALLLKKKKAAARKEYYNIAKNLFILTLAMVGLKYYLKSEKPKVVVTQANSVKEVKEATPKTVVTTDQNFTTKLNKDRRTVKVTTAVPFTGEVEFRFISIPKKVLQTSYIEFFGKGMMQNGELTIDKYSFERGSRVVDGFYNVYIRGEKKLNFMEELQEEAPLINLQAERFVSLMSKKAFNRKLKRMYRKVLVNESRYWSELKQKYLTVKMITSNIRKEVDKIFEVKNEDDFKAAVKKFERNYTANYGKFFTSFVISNENSYYPLKKKNFKNKNEIISTYSKLTRLSKRIGTDTMEILHKMETAESPDMQALRAESTKPLDNIISQIDSNDD
jgi:hypothetical protein